MPKITDEELVTIQLRLFKSDHATLKRMFTGQIGVNRAIRTIIRTYVRQAEAKANAVIDASESAMDIAEQAEANHERQAAPSGAGGADPTQVYRELALL